MLSKTLQKLGGRRRRGRRRRQNGVRMEPVLGLRRVGEGRVDRRGPRP